MRIPPTQLPSSYDSERRTVDGYLVPNLDHKQNNGRC